MVKIEFGIFSGPPPGTHYLAEWYNNAPNFDTASAISTATDQNNIDASLDQGFVISGQVRAPGGVGVPNAFVGASLGAAAQCCTGAGGTNTDPTGHYRLVLRAGIYRINVNFPPERHLVGQWWAGVPGGTAYFQRATDILLGPADAPDRDFDVQTGSVIRGHVSDAATGLAVGGFGVTANDAVIPCCEGLAFTGTDPFGNYFLVVPAGRPVRVFFGGRCIVDSDDALYVWEDSPYPQYFLPLNAVVDGVLERTATSAGSRPLPAWKTLCPSRIRSSWSAS